MSIDRLRGADGVIRVLAIDHRDSLRTFLRPDDPDGVAVEELVSIKRALVDAISPLATGVMLEPEYSIPQCLDVLAPGVGFLAALESQGYLDDPARSVTTLHWSVADAAATGPTALKLLLPYHPDHRLAPAQREVAAGVAAAAVDVGVPLVLEPLFHSLASPDDRERVVLTTVEHFADAGADLLKLPFPVDPSADDAARRAACAAVTRRCRQPWALLSGGGDFDAFADQAAIAVEAGAAGYMVGRALWGEAALAPPDRRAQVLDDVVVPRWRRLEAMVRS